jgi:hypothetical protein
MKRLVFITIVLSVLTSSCKEEPAMKVAKRERIEYAARTLQKLLDFSQRRQQETNARFSSAGE